MSSRLAVVLALLASAVVHAALFGWRFGERSAIRTPTVIVSLLVAPGAAAGTPRHVEIAEPLPPTTPLRQSPVTQPRRPVTRSVSVPFSATNRPSGDPPAASEGVSRGTAAAAQSGGGTAESGGAESGYLTLLASQLNRHKVYPEPARRQGQEGLVVLRLLVERSGKVREYGVAEPAAHESLNRAALSMVKEAAPFPPLPEYIAGPELSLLVPVRFALN